MSNPTNETILQEAQRLIYGDRNTSYGNPLDDFKCSADMLSAYLSRKYGMQIVLEPEDIPAMMVCVKLSRQANHPKRDNLVDLAGYAGCWDWVLTEKANRAST